MARYVFLCLTVMTVCPDAGLGQGCNGGSAQGYYPGGYSGSYSNGNGNGYTSRSPQVGSYSNGNGYSNGQASLDLALMQQQQRRLFHFRQQHPAFDLRFRSSQYAGGGFNGFPRGY